MLVDWSQILSCNETKSVWTDFVKRKISARKLDTYQFEPTVKTLVNKLGVERLRDLARKALERRK